MSLAYFSKIALPKETRGLGLSVGFGIHGPAVTLLLWDRVVAITGLEPNHNA